MELRKLTLLFWLGTVVFLFALVAAACAQQTIAPFKTQQANTDFYVNMGNTTLTTIQKTVTAACAYPTATTVVILPGSNPSDTIAGLTSACTSVGIIDQRVYPAVSYTCTSGGCANAQGTVVTSFNTRTGAVTLGATDVNAVGAITNNTTGTAANLSGTPALPNGTTATTQTTGDNTAKLATDAFVLANVPALFPATQGFVYNTSPTASRNATSSDFYNNLTYTRGETLWGFGDSTVNGSLGASVVSKAFFSILCGDYGGVCVNEGTGGALMTQIAYNTLSQLTITDYLTPTRVLIEGGINDASVCGATTGCLNNMTLSLDAAIAWAGLPYNQKLMASTATQTGTWTADTVITQPMAGTTGTAMVSSTTGSTLTFTVNNTTVGSVGSKIGVTYAPTVSGTGTFTFSIDSVLQTDVCSGTTTFTVTGCGATLNPASAPAGIFRQEFTVSGASHSVVINVTSGASAVEITHVDVAPTSMSTTSPIVLALGVLYQDADANSATTAAMNTAFHNTVTSLDAQNVNVTFVDVRGGTPGVNFTTDMGTNSLCGSFNPGTLHPNDCGYYHEALTVENAANAAGAPFTVPNSGARNGSFTNPLTTTGNVNSNSTAQDWNPNTSGTEIMATGISFFNAFGNQARMGFGKDTSGNFVLQAMGTTGASIGFETLACSYPITGQASCTPTMLIDSSGHMTKLSSITVPSASVLTSTTTNDLAYFDNATGHLADSGVLKGGLVLLNAANQFGNFTQTFGLTSSGEVQISNAALSALNTSNATTYKLDNQTGAVGPKVYTVATLPAAGSVQAGSMLVVSDASTFTVGTCTGGGSDTMIAVTNGTTWTCH